MPWGNVKLGDITEVITKGTTPTSVGFKYTDSGINFVKVESITTNGSFLAHKFASISGDCHEALKRSQLKEGDILFSIAGALGRTALVTPDILPANTNQALAIVRLKKNIEIDKQYLLLALMTGVTSEQVNRHKGGVAQQNLSLAQLKSFEVPLPPLPEQKRIVTILDKAFAEIEQARALAEKNLNNARELFESYLQQVFSQRGEGWNESALGELCKFQNGFAFKSADTVDKSNTQLIRMGNLYQNVLDLNRKPSFYPDEFYSEHRRYQLSAGDLIISLTGTVGKEDYGFTVEIPETDVDLLLNQRIAKFIDIDSTKIDKRFLLRILRSREFLDKLYATARGTRQANLSTVTMSALTVHYPSLNIQNTLCNKLETLENQTTELYRVYQDKITALDELKKSILQQAFSGQLTSKEVA